MSLQVLDTALDGVKILRPDRHGDNRGFLSEVYRRSRYRDAGIHFDVVQEIHSRSEKAGTVRGLHYQAEPRAQAKLVRVTRGAVLDVALDLRRSSPTFGRHVAVTLSAAEWNQLLIPAGFAHGYCTLEPESEVVYLLSDEYSPEHERGVLWSDPDLGIEWPVPAGAAVVSAKDRLLPPLAAQEALFP